MTASSTGPLIETISTTALISALEGVIAKGLPLSEETAGETLPNLRSVYARSVVPSDRLSRISALNQLLPRLIITIDDPQWREATQILFALAPGTKKASLTERQRRAADVLGYNPGHFRQRRQVDVFRSLALVIQEDLLRYRSRVKRAAESLEPTGDTPRLGPEHLNHAEELVPRIWQHVYGLRAELIAHLRLSPEAGFEAQAEDHRQAGLRERDELRVAISEYTQTYGEALIKHGETAFSPEALERLAGWDL